MRPIDECKRIVEKICKHWDPPLIHDPRTVHLESCVQTAAVTAMAVVMQDEFPMRLLTPLQAQVVHQGLAMYEQWLAEGEL